MAGSLELHNESIGEQERAEQEEVDSAKDDAVEQLDLVEEDERVAEHDRECAYASISVKVADVL